MSTFQTAAIADRIYQDLTHRLRQDWQQRLSTADRQLIHACCVDAAELEVRAMAAPLTRQSQQALLAEKAQINAQLANLAAAGMTEVASAFWDAVRLAVNTALAIAFAAV